MGNPLSQKELKLIDAYWRAANYLWRSFVAGSCCSSFPARIVVPATHWHPGWRRSIAGNRGWSW